MCDPLRITSLSCLSRRSSGKKDGKCEGHEKEDRGTSWVGDTIKEASKKFHFHTHGLLAVFVRQRKKAEENFWH